MDNWETHNLVSSSTMKGNGTHIDVYDNDIKVNEQEENKKDKEWDNRMEELKPPNYPPIDEESKDWEKKHEKYKQRMRSDPSYQFIMMVAGFANVKLDKLWTTPSEEPSNSAVESSRGLGTLQFSSDSMDRLSKEQAFQHKWTTIPEVSGIVYLSPVVYGHLMEAHDIYKTKGGTKSLNNLMVSPHYKVNFARLVSLRMKISGFLSGLNYQLDRNYRRLMTQQTMCLRSLIVKTSVKRDSIESLLLSPEDIREKERYKKSWNNILGRYT